MAWPTANIRERLASHSMADGGFAARLRGGVRAALAVRFKRTLGSIETRIIASKHVLYVYSTEQLSRDGPAGRRPSSYYYYYYHIVEAERTCGQTPPAVPTHVWGGTRVPSAE